MKDKIILHTLMYIVYSKKEDKEIVLQELKAMYKHFHLFTSKVPKIELKDALEMFIENKSGYKVTLNKLFYSL